MATVAARGPKRDLAPDWRDALRASLKRFAVRTWGALLVAIAVGGAVALATHTASDRSLSTAAGDATGNWLGSPGAYASDAMSARGSNAESGSKMSMCRPGATFPTASRTPSSARSSTSSAA